MARKSEQNNSSQEHFMLGNSANLSPKRSTVAALLYIEASLVLALGVWLVVLGFTHEEKELPPLIGVVIFAILGAIGLFASARGYVKGKSFGRSPTILANLIAVGVAYYQIQGRSYIGAVIILALALPTLYFAFMIAKEEG
jgi:intracellular septation protein A